MKPCRHLDFTEGNFMDCTLIDISDQFDKASGPVRYWQRGKRWTDAGKGQPSNPMNVQFCGAGRGRISGIFQCYNSGEMRCYEAEVESKTPEGGAS